MHLTALLEFALRMLQDGGKSVPAVCSNFWSIFSRPAAGLVLTAMWQGAAVALGLALCLRLAPRSPARHRFALWAAGFGAAIGLQVLPLILRLIPAHLVGAGGSIAPSGAAAAFHPWLLSAAWGVAIAACWLAASLWRAGDLAVHSLHLRKLWKTAVPVEIDPASLPRSLGRLSRSTIQICTTSQLERPSVIGFFAPRILIPDWLFPRLSPAELDQIVLHETEHLRRRDDWTNLLQKLCLVLFPLNPGLAWIELRMCREREMACDDGVIRITRAPRAYAACLASLAERGLKRRAGALSLGAWRGRPELVRRVHSILRRKHALNPLAARAVLGAVGCVLLAGAMALARCPRLVAFEPAHSAAADQVASAEPASTFIARDYASITHESSAHDLAAQDFTAPVSTSGLAGMATHRAAVLKGHDFSRAEEAAVLKGRDFSRAENYAKLTGALAPEGNPSHSADSHRAAQVQAANAAAGSRHKAGFSQPAPATESALLHSGRAGAGPVFRPDNSFIVMSTWEAFEIAPAEICQKQTESKTSACNEPLRVAGPANALTTRRITPRITVTRMILKIYSAGDRGSTWLVIQL